MIWITRLELDGIASMMPSHNASLKDSHHIPPQNMHLMIKDPQGTKKGVKRASRRLNEKAKVN